MAFADLCLEVSKVRFIEEESLPVDAKVVDSTWRYVNNNGAPDRRFKDNYEIPIALYETLHFKSSTGLNELIQISAPGVGEPLGQCFRALANNYPADGQADS